MVLGVKAIACFGKVSVTSKRGTDISSVGTFGEIVKTGGT